MPRRSGGGGFRRPAPAPAAPRRQYSSVPARAPPAAPAPVAAQPRQPGLMAQMATTAAGVAVGSAVGHTLGAAMTGGMGGGGHQEAPPAQYQEPIAPVQQQTQQPMICSNELNQFLECAKNYESDLTLCAGFNEALRQCKIQNAMS